MRTLEEVASSFERRHPGIALAVARIGPGGAETRYLNCDPSNRFEMGSITKLFTAILLAEAVQDGRCELDDPVGKWLPTNSRTLKFLGKPITLRHLATHTSGLPRLPLSMLFVARTRQPYGKWDRRRLLGALSRTFISRPPGSTYVYSNFGFAVLGASLEAVYGRGYGEVVEELTNRLGCPGIRLPKAGEASLTPRGLDVEPWRLEAFASAGALTATLDDLVRFAAKNLEAARPQPLNTAMEERGTYPNRQPLPVGLPKALIWSALAALLSQADPKAFSIWCVGLATMAAGPLGGGIATLALVAACVKAHSDPWWPLVYGVLTTLLMTYTGRLTRTQTLGLGWHISGKEGQDVFWHNGGTAGFRSYLAVSPATQTTVVVLAAHNKGVDALGTSLLKA